MFIFDINYIVFNVMGYPLSIVELVTIVFGLLNVWLAVKENPLNYPAGLIDTIFFFAIFYQIHIYIYMVFQAYCFFIFLYGWWKWTHPEKNMANKNNQLKASTNSLKLNIYIALGIIASSFVTGFIMKSIYSLIPSIAENSDSLPYYDSFITIASIVAMYLVAKKKVEAWALWIIVDSSCIPLCIIKKIPFVSIQYFVFFLLGIYGLISWHRSALESHDTGNA